MNEQKKKPRVYVEKAKLRHTTHWDMDYLTNEEVNSLYGLGPPGSPEPARDEPLSRKHAGRKRTLVIGVALIVITALVLLAWYLI